MHTAEHILSAVMRKFYEAPRNLEFHLGEKKTKCDYETPRPLGDADFKQIEALVNGEIAKDHPVSNFITTREQAAGYDLWKVPPDANEISTYKIGDFDEQPCGGPHVTRTSEVGTFRVLSYELRENGRVRIRFRVE
jgi:Ser-tRNA(Ala) deacylase AlaX